MNFGEYRKAKAALASTKKRTISHEYVRPKMTTQEEKFLYSLRLKTMEYRTLMSAIKTSLPQSTVDTIIVEYAMRLRKARKNFDSNNYDYEWELLESEIF